MDLVPGCRQCRPTPEGSWSSWLCLTAQWLTPTMRRTTSGQVMVCSWRSLRPSLWVVKWPMSTAARTSLT